MNKSRKRSNVVKVYCERCDTVFNSKEEYERHLQRHSTVTCESCPIDTAISKLVGFFKRNK